MDLELVPELVSGRGLELESDRESVPKPESVRVSVQERVSGWTSEKYLDSMPDRVSGEGSELESDRHLVPEPESAKNHL